MVSLPLPWRQRAGVRPPLSLSACLPTSSKCWRLKHEVLLQQCYGNILAPHHVPPLADEQQVRAYPVHRSSLLLPILLYNTPFRRAMRYLLMSLRPNDVALLKLGRGNDTLRRTDWRIEGPGVLCAFHGDDGEVHWRGWRLFVYALQFNTFIARGERSRKTRSL